MSRLALILPVLVSVSVAACATSEPTCAELEQELVDCLEDGSCSPESFEEVEDARCEQGSEFSDELAEDPGQPHIFPEPEGTATKYPIVLAHGFGGSPTNKWGVHEDIIAELKQDEHKVYVAAVPPFQAVPARAEVLASFIDEVLADSGAAKVNIIAHSMGGLDSRYLVSKLGYSDRVAAVVTISTPHHGTAVGDVGLGLVSSPWGPGVFLNYLFKVYARSFTDKDLAANTSLYGALSSVAERNSAAFNADVTDHPEVYYQSWAGVSHIFRRANQRAQEECTADGGTMYHNPDKRDFMNLELVMAAPIIAHFRSDPHDGMATVASARWGDFQGCVPADHYDEIGQIGNPGKRKKTGFSAIRFFRHIAYDLAARGY